VIHKPEKAAKSDSTEPSERSANADKPAPSNDREDDSAADTETSNAAGPDATSHVVRAADAGH